MHGENMQTPHRKANHARTGNRTGDLLAVRLERYPLHHRAARELVYWIEMHSTNMQHDNWVYFLTHWQKCAPKFLTFKVQAADQQCYQHGYQLTQYKKQTV